MQLQAGGEYLLRTKQHEMTVYGIGWEPGRGSVAHCAVEFPEGKTFEIYELNGRYNQDDIESDWDAVEVIKEPEAEKIPEKLHVIKGAFQVDGRPVYLYVTEDIHKNKLAQALRVSSDPAYGNGYRRINPNTQTDKEFKWSIENPPQ